MSILSLRLVRSIYHMPSSMPSAKAFPNQLAATALAEKLAALAAEDYITQRGLRTVGRDQRRRLVFFSVAAGTAPQSPENPAPLLPQ